MLTWPFLGARHGERLRNSGSDSGPGWLGMHRADQGGFELVAFPLPPGSYCSQFGWFHFFFVLFFETQCHSYCLGCPQPHCLAGDVVLEIEPRTSCVLGKQLIN